VARVWLGRDKFVRFVLTHPPVVSILSAM